MKCKTSNESSDELRAPRDMLVESWVELKEYETESQAHSKKVIVVIIQVFVIII